MIPSIARKTLLSLAAALTTASSSQAATLCVDPTDMSCHATIQAAVDVAAPADTIAIAAGTYFENVTVPSGRDGLILDGAGNAKTILDGATPAPGGDTLTISSANVTVSELGVRNGARGIVTDTGINGLIVDGVAFQGLHGTCLDVTGNGATVSGSTFRGCANFGIHCIGDGLSVTKSTFRHIGEDGGNERGVYAEGSAVVVTKNTFQLTNGAIDIHGNAFQVVGNKISDTYNTGIAVFCSGCTTGLVAKNKISDSADDSSGITAEAVGTGLVIEGNSITRTADEAIYIEGSGTTVRKNKIRSIGGDDDEPCVEIIGSGLTFAKNKASLCVGHGFYTSDNGNLFTGNSVSKAFVNGFQIDASDSVLTGNKAKANLGTGFVITSNASNTTLTGNKSSKNRTDLCDEGILTTLTDNSFATTMGGCGLE